MIHLTFTVGTKILSFFNKYILAIEFLSGIWFSGLVKLGCDLDYWHYLVISNSVIYMIFFSSTLLNQCFQYNYYALSFLCFKYLQCNSFLKHKNIFIFCFLGFRNPNNNLLLRLHSPSVHLSPGLGKIFTDDVFLLPL